MASGSPSFETTQSVPANQGGCFNVNHDQHARHRDPAEHYRLWLVTDAATPAPSKSGTQAPGQ